MKICLCLEGPLRFLYRRIRPISDYEQIYETRHAGPMGQMIFPLYVMIILL